MAFCYNVFMNQWSRNRKRIVLGIVTLAVLILVGLPAFFLFYRAPTCFDGKMNGDERGVDCGGSCQLLCSSESVPLLLQGDPRVLTLSTNTYQVVALVKNSNNDAEIYNAGYTIKVYEATGAVPVLTIEGETYVPKGATFAIFEGPLVLEEGKIPQRATLEWKDDSIVWKKNDTEVPELVVRNQVYSRLDESPRLEAIVENQGLQNISNIDLVAVISDAQGNVFAASKTFVDSLAPGERSSVVFTWPRPFGHEIADTDIIVRVFPDRSFIR